MAVNVWRDNPFNPYAVARLRTTAFQKTVVMKYIDNLIAWGDQLFRGDTIETINEATQLYVLAAEILGRRPEVIERKVQPPVQTFNSLGQLGPLSNALEQIELADPRCGDGGATDDGEHGRSAAKCSISASSANDKLLGYWDTVADRLFKIRHCMNIEGQVRQLAAVRAADRSGTAGARAGGRPEPWRRPERHLGLAAELPLLRHAAEGERSGCRGPQSGRGAAVGARKAGCRGAVDAALRPGAAPAPGGAGCSRQADRRGERQHRGARRRARRWPRRARDYYESRGS